MNRTRGRKKDRVRTNDEREHTCTNGGRGSRRVSENNIFVIELKILSEKEKKIQ